MKLEQQTDSMYSVISLNTGRYELWGIISIRFIQCNSFYGLNDMLIEAEQNTMWVSKFVDEDLNVVC